MTHFMSYSSHSSQLKCTLDLEHSSAIWNTCKIIKDNYRKKKNANNSHHHVWEGNQHADYLEITTKNESHFSQTTKQRIKEAFSDDNNWNWWNIFKPQTENKNKIANTHERKTGGGGNYSTERETYIKTDTMKKIEATFEDKNSYAAQRLPFAQNPAFGALKRSYNFRI